MKLAIATLLVASAAAFAPSAPAFRTTALNGGPAKSAEEDLELTRKVILAAIDVGDKEPEEKEEEKEE